jgi:hypothetical protein
MINLDLAARAYNALCSEHAEKLNKAAKALNEPALCPLCLNVVGLTSHTRHLREHKLAPNGLICAGAHKAPLDAMQAALDQPAVALARPLYKAPAAAVKVEAPALDAQYQRAYEALAADYAAQLTAAPTPSAVCVFCRVVVPLYRGRLKAHKNDFLPFCDGNGKTPAEAVAGAVVLGRFVLPAPAEVVEVEAPAEPVEAPAELVEAPAELVEAPAELVEAPAPVSIAPALERLAQLNAEAEALRAQLLARRAQLLAELDAINAALGL